jgi:hypothetical protein
VILSSLELVQVLVAILLDKNVSNVLPSHTMGNKLLVPVKHRHIHVIQTAGPCETDMYM